MSTDTNDYRPIVLLNTFIIVLRMAKFAYNYGFFPKILKIKIPIFLRYYDY